MDTRLFYCDSASNAESAFIVNLIEINQIVSNFLSLNCSLKYVKAVSYARVGTVQEKSSKSALYPAAQRSVQAVNKQTENISTLDQGKIFDQEKEFIVDRKISYNNGLAQRKVVASLCSRMVCPQVKLKNVSFIYIY